MHDEITAGLASTTQAVSQLAPAADLGEALIERRLTFRNSTFGAVKSFIRAHKRRTGIELTNSAAVDMLLRRQLARDIHPAAFGEMLKLSRPAALQALQAIPSGDSDDGPGSGPEGSGRVDSCTAIPTPPPDPLVPSSGFRIINVNVSGPRAFVRRGAA